VSNELSTTTANSPEPPAPLDGKQYFFAGSSLMVLKYIVDTLVAGLVFHSPWSFLDYLIPGASYTLGTLVQAKLVFYLCMLGIALPFTVVGVYLTARRLRSARLPVALMFLFFVPVMNLIFFLLLCFMPERSRKNETLLTADDSSSNTLVPPAVPSQGDARSQLWADAFTEHDMYLPRRDNLATQAGPTLLSKLIPEDDKQAIWRAALLPLPIGIATGALAVFALGSYGWGLFVGCPFAVAIAAPLLYAYHKERRLMECIRVSTLSLFMLCSAILVIPIEGVICLAMASPLIVAIGVIGGLVAWMVQHRDRELPKLPSMFACFIGLVAAVTVAEASSCPHFPLYRISSTVDIDAPPERVWSNLIDFPPLPPPEELMFKAGVAYPIRATITGRGPGAVRRCIFSTGAFVEPITTWDAPRRLAFGVVEQPAPMRELSYRELHPRHLDNYLVSKQGEFLLEPLAGGRCRLIGTTWYENHMDPGVYWRLWSDSIIHGIHMRVLMHVKHLSEQRELTLRP
jgi:uncharacterized membrane protein YhaH (DUF805 family)